MAITIILIILIVILVIFGGVRMALAYAESRRAKAFAERALVEMRLREALEDQLAEEREKRVKLEKELAEFHKNQMKWTRKNSPHMQQNQQIKAKAYDTNQTLYLLGIP